MLGDSGDVIHELSEDSRNLESAVPTLIHGKWIVLEPSMIEQIRGLRTIRRAILHHQL